MKASGADKSRMYFFDNLRAAIILIMVFFHVAMGYTTWDLKWWYVNDIQKNSFFDLFVFATDVYIMPVMFFIAGYFAPAVLLKQGLVLFWRNKLIRIVLPWLGGVLMIAPLIAYSAIFSRTEAPPSYFSFWLYDFFGAYYQQAHYWFLEILAAFFLLFTTAYSYKPEYFKQQLPCKQPSVRFFTFFALLSAVPFFVANLFFWVDAWVRIDILFVIQPVRIGLYLCYFSLGIYAWKQAWFSETGYRPPLFQWGIPAVLLLFLFLFYRVNFTLSPEISPLHKAGHALLFSFFSLTATFTFIAFFQKFADSDAYLWRRLAANSYTIYFIHQCVVIPLAYMVKNLSLNVWVKYAGVSVVSVVLCFLIAEYWIRPLIVRGNMEKRKRLTG
ncbi:acyltransferase family protein [Propionispora sp. 2/2-37]|uniref:acyltransferase family protein n=1 Tax=Propionispora sp. 2/2-37 TaxID=1677858 RepID=UPI0006BB7864|nr:acyltransferase family protein [Propionispora sp. 2/2-37]